MEPQHPKQTTKNNHSKPTLRHPPKPTLTSPEATAETNVEASPETTAETTNESSPETTNEPTNESSPETTNEPTNESSPETTNEPSSEPLLEKTDAGEPLPEAGEPLPEVGCKNKETRSCYTGTQGTAGVGLCKTGIETCDNGTWGPCQGQIVGVPEECNNKDDDCNGKIDENLTRGCSSKCGSGTETCQNGTWGGCNAKPPKAEDCNGQDDDCDGQIDNNLPVKGCTLQKGVCNGAAQTCQNGQWVDCTTNDYKNHNAAYEPTETLCDGKDNDCNGTIDTHCTCISGTSRDCYTGSQGCISNGTSYVCTTPCKTGTQKCENGQWATCSGDIPNKTEACNGIDDDCDGQTDNNLIPSPCANQNGVCSGAKETCKGGAWSCDYAANNPNDYETTETKCDGKDNDCDGLVDEGVGCVCVPNTTQPCYTQGTGCTFSNGNYKCNAPCKAGTQTCLPDGKGWGDCSGEITPKAEECNNIDDDCNGIIDDTPSSLCYAVTTKSPYYCAQGFTSCKNGISTCNAISIALSCQSNTNCAVCPQRSSFPTNATCQIQLNGKMICAY